MKKAEGKKEDGQSSSSGGAESTKEKYKLCGFKHVPVCWKKECAAAPDWWKAKNPACRGGAKFEELLSDPKI